MGILDALDYENHRPEMWAGAILFIVFFVESLVKGGGLLEALTAGVIAGMVGVLLMGVGKKTIGR